MYDKLLDVNLGVKSLKQLADINNAAIEKLVRQQAEYLNAVVKGSVEHAKTMSAVKDLKSATEAQKSFITSMNQKFLDAAKLNLQVAIETRDALATLMEAGVKQLQPVESRKAA